MIVIAFHGQFVLKISCYQNPEDEQEESRATKPVCVLSTIPKELYEKQEEVEDDMLLKSRTSAN